MASSALEQTRCGAIGGIPPRRGADLALALAFVFAFGAVFIFAFGFDLGTAFGFAFAFGFARAMELLLSSLLGEGISGRSAWALWCG
jgi:hypothetical protein